MEGSVALSGRQERRARPREVWTQQYDGVWVRDVDGHHIVIKEGKFDHCFYKWIDKHFRGIAKTLAAAQEQLELEANGGRPAWTSPT